MDGAQRLGAKLRRSFVCGGRGGDRSCRFRRHALSYVALCIFGTLGLADAHARPGYLPGLATRARLGSGLHISSTAGTTVAPSPIRRSLVPLPTTSSSVLPARWGRTPRPSRAPQTLASRLWPRGGAGEMERDALHTERRGHTGAAMGRGHQDWIQVDLLRFRRSMATKSPPRLIDTVAPAFRARAARQGSGHR